MPPSEFFEQWERDEHGGRRALSPRAQRLLALVGGLAVLLCYTAYSSYFVVEPEEVGVVTLFGKYVRTAPPGLHLQWPWGIERAFKVPVKRVRKEEFGFRTLAPGVQTQYHKGDFSSESLMLTGDLNIAEVEWIVQYKISDPIQYLFNIQDPRKALRDASEAMMREVVGDHSVTEVLTSGREEVNDEVKRRLQKVLDVYACGLRIVTVKLQDVHPPDKVKASFNEVNQAKQEKEQMINRALQERNKVVPLAKGEAQKMIAEAEGFRTERINHARGDADRFTEILKAYRKAPEITRRRLYLETLRTVLPKIKRKIILDPAARGLVPLLHLEGEKARRLP